jgi:hypothetical protein
MLLKVDHYTSLARAVARLERDSYEARGAVYDRALTALVKRLNSAVPPHSQADIDMELLAFREAVRRVEFGDLDDQEWLAQQDELPPELPPEDVPPAVPHHGHAVLAIPPEPVATDDAAPPHERAIKIKPPHRSVFGRVAGRTLLAVLLLGIGIAGYAHATGQLDLAPLVQRVMDQIAALELPGQGSDGPRLMDASGAPEKATYYEQGSGGWTQTTGKALWRARLEPVAGPGRKTEPVLMLDVQVPERGLELAVSVRRDTSENAAMSHLIELQFAPSKDFPVDGISGVMGISLKNTEDKNSTALAGLSVRVAPGVFLFGLSADKDETARNVELLRTQSRIEIPVAFVDGRTGIISIDKGTSGQQLLDDVLAKWAQ